MILKKSSQSKMSRKIAVTSLTALLLITVGSSPLTAQNIPAGKSTTAVPFQDKMEKPYKYEPIDPEYWKIVEEQLKDETYIKVIEEGLELSEDYGADSDDGLEGLLAVGIALRTMKID